MTPPSNPVVSVAQAKKHLEIAQDDLTHDAQIENLISAAFAQWCVDTALVPIETEFDLMLDNFPEPPLILLPVRPVTELISVTYFDGDSEETTLSEDVATLDRSARNVYLRYGQVWPTIPTQHDAVAVRFKAGSESTADVLKYVQQAILLQVGKWFEDRDMAESVSDDQFDRAYERIVRRYLRSSYP